MKNNKQLNVLQELFLNDFLIGTCFWSLILIILIPFITLPQSLSMTLYIFFITVCLICLPFSLYKIRTALHLAKKGFELTVTNISIEKCYFGQKIKFKYEYDGQTYYKSKYFHSIFFLEKAPLKILIDSMNPSKFIILEFKKKSVVSVVKERNS